ncbi:MAG TPA: Ig-like domain-containing protein [Gemmatimonadales bacterium]|jgi:uncharacterized protein YjdB
MPALLMVDPPSDALPIGGQMQLAATPRSASGLEIPNRDVTWFSRGPDIATVSSSGLVTAVFSGRTEIVAVTQPSTVQVKVGRTRQLDVFLLALSGKPLTDRPVVFEGDRPGIAAVSSSSLVVAVAPGETIIRARSEGKEGTARVTVAR